MGLTTIWLNLECPTILEHTFGESLGVRIFSYGYEYCFHLTTSLLERRFEQY